MDEYGMKLILIIYPFLEMIVEYCIQMMA